MKLKKIKFNKKRKKIYLLPNLLTTANFFCGIYSLFLSINGNYQKAAWVIFIAMLFDFLDGQAARMQKASSRFGMEYDSLADMVSFGIAPAVLIYFVCFKGAGRIGLATIFIYSASCALRLARYNTHTLSLNEESRKNISLFSGIPSPAAAGLIASLIITFKKYELVHLGKTIPIVAICLAYLMISTIKYPKFSRLIILRENHFLTLFMTIAAISTIIFFPAIFFLLGFLTYTFLGIAKTLKNKYIVTKDKLQERVIKNKTP